MTDFTATSAGAGSVTFADLAVGNYALSALPAADDEWFLGTLVCAEEGPPSEVLDVTDFTVYSGESIHCTIENVKDGRIIVDKVTDPPLDETEFDFTWGLVDGHQEEFTLSDAADPYDSGPLHDGSYNVVEDVPEGWRLANLTCVNEATGEDVDVSDELGAEPNEPQARVDLAAGDVVVCTFTNEKETPAVPDPSDPDSADPDPTNPDSAETDEGEQGETLPLTGMSVAHSAWVTSMLLMAVGAVLSIGGARRRRSSEDR
jgi:hypothetical protein